MENISKINLRIKWVIWTINNLNMRRVNRMRYWIKIYIIIVGRVGR